MISLSRCILVHGTSIFWRLHTGVVGKRTCSSWLATWLAGVVVLAEAVSRGPPGGGGAEGRHSHGGLERRGRMYSSCIRHPIRSYSVNIEMSKTAAWVCNRLVSEGWTLATTSPPPHTPSHLRTNAPICIPSISLSSPCAYHSTIASHQLLR